MFDTIAVARRIREARIARDMTQMALADAMGVSYQAVSNWERGNSMPDISKLENLCQTLDLSLEELLGGEPRQTATVVRLQQGETPPVEALADIAPVVPPRELEQAAGQAAKEKKIDWEALERIAPHLDGELLDEILKSVPRHDYSGVERLAPYLSEGAIEGLMLGYTGDEPEKVYGGLAPYASEETLDKLAAQCVAEGKTGKALEVLYPYLSSGSLRRLVHTMANQGDFEALGAAAIYL